MALVFRKLHFKSFENEYENIFQGKINKLASEKMIDFTNTNRIDVESIFKTQNGYELFYYGEE